MKIYGNNSKYDHDEGPNTELLISNVNFENIKIVKVEVS